MTHVLSDARCAPFNRRFRAPLLAAAGLGLALSAGAAPQGWVLNTNQTLDLVDLATNADTPANSLPFGSTSLAATPGGQLISADAFGNLWDVTGPPIPIGPTGRTQIGDLDWAPGGLWGYSNASQELFFYDFGLATVTLAQGIVLPGGRVVTGVAHEAASGDVLLAATQGLNNDSLWRVPSAATSAVPVGLLAHGDSFSFISDIDFDAGGTLYAVTWFHRWFYSVSTTTAATTLLSAGPHRDTTAMALSPVPEPASAALLALGLGWLAGRSRRRVPRRGTPSR